jgi:hypothetical protein
MAYESGCRGLNFLGAAYNGGIFLDAVGHLERRTVIPRPGVAGNAADNIRGQCRGQCPLARGPANTVRGLALA